MRLRRNGGGSFAAELRRWTAANAPAAGGSWCAGQCCSPDGRRQSKLKPPTPLADHSLEKSQEDGDVS